MTVNTAVDEALSDKARAFNLFNPPEDYFDNPSPFFRLLRDGDPVHTQEDGSVLLTRYDDVRQIWRDVSGLVNKREQFCKRFGEGPLLEHHTSTMLFRDNPDHDRLRNIVNPFFSQNSIQMLSRFTQEVVDREIEKVKKMGEFDFVRDFAFRIPVALICKIIGVPVADADHIQAIGRKVLFPLNPKVSETAIAEGHDAVTEFKNYLRPFLDEIKSRPTIDPTESILCAMAAAQREGVEVSDDEILHMCIVTLNGGHETTTNLISQSIHFLMDDTESLSQLRGGEVPIAPALEELIRFITPLQLQGRRTTQEVVLESGNGTLPAGTEVVLCQASANRDERIFGDPDKLNLSRRPNNHVGFGAGIHVCLGRPLARLEASIAIPTVLRELPTLTRNGKVRFQHNTRFRGLELFPVKLA
ncbi:cytochrome P450 [Allorhizobium sp. NPDC080224]|uniref:Cytochrome P450 n=2 Tax=Alphaproteobacteria TaxID=28211 RepID=A0A512HKQ9_9HYPH|nr:MULTISPECIES: cytochrome P450 [Alphaproteobacteria]NTE55355.1 cytochrome P450 [Agrobacterium tumefaciens]NTE72741.1 cytochrome P450 [Agrobacterium tumefaciens]GEO86000.1 cytochrome P450 [Ciceribacter naphthalenivorans]GLR23507.1 cytochrome P450 [Ciceribacter naphthalenivorans]GLT06363.1 cytochrome P450 [Sphingomonas psychrolutea]